MAKKTNGKPSRKAVEIAARVWCDFEMSKIEMDSVIAMQIATLIDPMLETNPNG